jgi:beta-glucosidase
MIRAYQRNKILACAKHFAAYSETHGGLDSTESDASRRKLQSFFLPAFKKAVEAGVGSFMAAYQSINGRPCSVNKWLQKDLLRDQWNFTGFIITDWDNIGQLVWGQKVAPDIETAAVLAVQAGSDMVLNTPKFHHACCDAVKKGRLSESLINESVRRVLRAKFELGLFEDDRYPDASKIRVGTPENRAIALTAARESVILLKNDGILPLSESSLKTVALLGPNSNHEAAQLGDWSGGGEGGEGHTVTITVLNGLKTRLPDATILHENGARIEPGETANLTAAIEAAKKADAIIVVVGDRARYWGERKSTATLQLQGTQLDLLHALVHLKKRFIINIIASKPLVIPQSIINGASAILTQFSSGCMGGQAFAEAIVGDFSPCGRLTITWPRHAGQLPVVYNSIRGQHGSTYADLTEAPQWSFGYGLTYSTVSYSGGHLDKTSYKKTDTIHLSLNVMNKGPFEVAEVVQVYVHDKVTSVTWCWLELKTYERVILKSGETKAVHIDLEVSECSLVNAQAERVVEPGAMELWIGKSAGDIILKLPFVIE